MLCAIHQLTKQVQYVFGLWAEDRIPEDNAAQKATSQPAVQTQDLLTVWQQCSAIIDKPEHHSNDTAVTTAI